MAISLNYRGEIKSKEANATVQWLKQNNKVSFVEWCPTGFKIGLNDVPAALLPTKDKEDKDFPSSELDIMAGATKNCVMIGNNVAVSRVCTGTSGKVWKKGSSPKPVRILDSSKRITSMS